MKNFERRLFLLIVCLVRTLFDCKYRGNFSISIQHSKASIELKNWNAEATLLHFQHRFIYESSLTENKPLLCNWVAWKNLAVRNSDRAQKGGVCFCCAVSGFSPGRLEHPGLIQMVRDWPLLFKPSVTAPFRLVRLLIMVFSRPFKILSLLGAKPMSHGLGFYCNSTNLVYPCLDWAVFGQRSKITTMCNKGFITFWRPVGMFT